MPAACSLLPFLSCYKWVPATLQHCNTATLQHCNTATPSHPNCSPNCSITYLTVSVFLFLFLFSLFSLFSLFPFPPLSQAPPAKSVMAHSPHWRSRRNRRVHRGSPERDQDCRSEEGQGERVDFTRAGVYMCVCCTERWLCKENVRARVDCWKCMCSHVFPLPLTVSISSLPLFLPFLSFSPPSLLLSFSPPVCNSATTTGPSAADPRLL